MMIINIYEKPVVNILSKYILLADINQLRKPPLPRVHVPRL